MSGTGKGAIGGTQMSRNRGPQGRATSQQSFGEFGSTPGGGQPSAPNSNGLSGAGFNANGGNEDNQNRVLPSKAQRRTRGVRSGLATVAPAAVRGTLG